jgi:hypothetical protein
MPEQLGHGAVECSRRRLSAAIIRLPFGREDAHNLVVDLTQALQ